MNLDREKKVNLILFHNIKRKAVMAKKLVTNCPKITYIWSILNALEDFEKVSKDALGVMEQVGSAWKEEKRFTKSPNIADDLLLISKYVGESSRQRLLETWKKVTKEENKLDYVNEESDRALEAYFIINNPEHIRMIIQELNQNKEEKNQDEIYKICRAFHDWLNKYEYLTDIHGNKTRKREVQYKKY